VALAIPHGKKYYAWFSYYNSQNVIYWMELNKDKKRPTPRRSRSKCSLG
jgi:hypothetical protein